MNFCFYGQSLDFKITEPRQNFLRLSHLIVFKKELQKEHIHSSMFIFSLLMESIGRHHEPVIEYYNSFIFYKLKFL